MELILPALADPAAVGDPAYPVLLALQQKLLKLMRMRYADNHAYLVLLKLFLRLMVCLVYPNILGGGSFLGAAGG